MIEKMILLSEFRPLIPTGTVSARGSILSIEYVITLKLEMDY
jgi:hypothetical protein